MMSHAHLNTELVENLPDVMRVNAVERERHRAATVSRVLRTVDAQTFDGCERVERVTGQLVLVCGDGGHVEPAQIVDRDAERDGFRDRRRTRLEPGRWR